MEVLEKTPTKRATGLEGIAARSDIEHRNPSDESTTSSATLVTLEKSIVMDTATTIEGSLCSSPKEAAAPPEEPKEAVASTTHLPSICTPLGSSTAPSPVINGSASEPDMQPGKTPQSSATVNTQNPKIVTKLTESMKKKFPPNRMDPLKMDMTKPSVMPLTSSQMSLQCLECHIIFSDNRSKKRHLKMSHPAEYEQFILGDSLFACYVCDRHFANSTELKAHQQTHTEKQPFKCPLCGKAFVRSSQLTTHKKVHLTGDGITCSHCGKIFKTLTQLKYHIRIHTGEKPYVCKRCGIRFALPKELNQHLEGHNREDNGGEMGDALLGCYVCGRIFDSSADLTAHQRTHKKLGTSKKQNKDGEEENGDQANPPVKIKKKRIVDPAAKKHACPYCKAMFKTEKTRHHHVKIKHPQKPTMPSGHALVPLHPLNQAPPPLAQAVIGQPPVLCLDSSGQASQCIEPEQIKKLIESLGNVQKVNQLVIYQPVAFPSQTVTLQPVAGAVQPIRFDTLPSADSKTSNGELKPSDTTQLTRQTALSESQLDGKQLVVPGTIQVVGEIQQSMETVADGQTQCQAVLLEGQSWCGEEAPIAETPSSVVETMATEPILLNSVDEGGGEMKASDMVQEGVEHLMPELQQSSSLIPTIELENENQHMVSLQEEVVQMQYFNPGDTLSLVVTDDLHQTEDQVITLTPVSPDSLTLTSAEAKDDLKKNDGLNNVQGIKKADLETSSEPKCALKPVQKQTSPTIPEGPSSKETIFEMQPTLQIIQNTQEAVSGGKEPKSNLTATLAKPVKKKKGRPPKKCKEGKAAKQQTSLKTKKPTVSHSHALLVSQQKEVPLSPPSQVKTTVSPDSQAKDHILVQFGLGHSKEKISKAVESLKKSDVKQQQKAPVGSKPKKASQGVKGKSTPEKKTTTEGPSKPQKQGLHKLQKEVAKVQGKPRKRKNKTNKSPKGKTNVLPIGSEDSALPVSPSKKRKQEKMKVPTTLPPASKSQTLLVKSKDIKEPEKKESSSSVSVDSVDALLLLKGHKQPQLKVHKLDAPQNPCQLEVLPNCASSVNLNTETQMAVSAATDNYSVSLKEVKHSKKPVKASVDPSAPLKRKASSMPKKVKASKKRKSSNTEAITCDSGVSSSKTLTLKEHAAATDSEKTSGEFGKAPYDNEAEVQMKDSTPTNVEADTPVHPKAPVLQVTTSWDTDAEVGELGLGDREDHRLSFPALSPSPSFLSVPPSAEVENEEVTKDSMSGVFEKDLSVVVAFSEKEEEPQTETSPVLSSVTSSPSEVLSLYSEPVPPKNTPEVPNRSAFLPLPDKIQKRNESALNVSRVKSVKKNLSKAPTTIREAGGVSKSTTKDSTQDVSLSSVQTHHKPVSSDIDNPVPSQKECSSQQGHNSILQGLSPAPNLESAADLKSTVGTTDSSEDPPDLKHFDEDKAVPPKRKKSGLNQNNVTRGGKRGGGRGRRGAGKNRNVESQAQTDAAPPLIDHHPPPGDNHSAPVADETNAEGGNGPEPSAKPVRSGLTDSPDDSSEEPVVFELESVTTSVEVSKSEVESQDRSDGSSPGVILEKFLTSRGNGNNETARISTQVLGDSSNIPSMGTSINSRTSVLPSLDPLEVTYVKEENLSQPVMPPALTTGGEEAQAPLINRSLSTEKEQGLRIFVVKLEDPPALPEPEHCQHPSVDQRQEVQNSNCSDSETPEESQLADRSLDVTDVSEVASSAETAPAARQCIFFPVKEEERELLLESPPRAANQLNTSMDGRDDISEISAQHDSQYVDSAFSEEDDFGSDQHNTTDLVEFLSQASDNEDSGGIDPEPEPETLALNSYHGSSGFPNSRAMASNGPGHNTENSNPQNGVSMSPDQKKPIDYFSSYLGTDTWKEIANNTAKLSKMTNPVSAEEVSQFVGIHIAMGTLQFPCTKLYWEEFTRVALIADAMSFVRFSEILSQLRLSDVGRSTSSQGQDTQVSGNSSMPGTQNPTGRLSESARDSQGVGKDRCAQLVGRDPLGRVRPLIGKVQKACQGLKREGNHGVSQYPLWLLRPTANPAHSLHHTVMLNMCGLVVDFSLSLDDSEREDTVRQMTLSGSGSREGVVFLCKPELSTPSMLEQLLESGVQSAGKVGGAKGQVGDEFVSSDGKLKLFRCHHGFILSAAVKGRSRSTSLVSGFERALKAAKLNQDLRNAYHTPCLLSSPAAWPMSVLWHLVDLALVNAWLQHRADHGAEHTPLTLMAFRLEVSKALTLSSGSDAQDAAPPQPHAPPERAEQDLVPESTSAPDAPLPDAAIRYDGIGHWPEQVLEGARCRFGGCDLVSQVRCLKCCVFLCISRHHNCFLKFHNQRSV